MILTTAQKMNHTSTDPAGRVEWPSLPPGHRWKVKRFYDSEGWGDDHGIKVSLQRRTKVGMWWPVETFVVYRESNKNIFECTSLTAQRVLSYVEKQHRQREARSLIIGIQQQDSY